MNAKQRHYIRCLRKDGRFNEPQLNHMAHCFSTGLSIEQVSIFADPCYDFAQMGCISNGIKSQYTREQLALYTNKDLAYYQMHMIMEAINKGLKTEEIRIFAKPEFSAGQMQTLTWAFKLGLGLDKVSVMANHTLENDDLRKLIKSAKNKTVEELEAKAALIILGK